jgi:hypothetical protein
MLVQVSIGKVRVGKVRLCNKDKFLVRSFYLLIIDSLMLQIRPYSELQL